MKNERGIELTWSQAIACRWRWLKEDIRDWFRFKDIRKVAAAVNPADTCKFRPESDLEITVDPSKIQDWTIIDKKVLRRGIGGRPSPVNDLSAGGDIYAIKYRLRRADGTIEEIVAKHTILPNVTPDQFERPPFPDGRYKFGSDE